MRTEEEAKKRVICQNHPYVTFSTFQGYRMGRSCCYSRRKSITLDKNEEKVTVAHVAPL